MDIGGNLGGIPRNSRLGDSGRERPINGCSEEIRVPANFALHFLNVLQWDVQLGAPMVDFGARS